jgi:hypothetical protein
MLLHDVNDTHKRLRPSTIFVIWSPSVFLDDWRNRKGQRTATNIKGTWSGIFLSRRPDISRPFTMTVKMSSDSRGHLIGDAGLSDCLNKHHVQETVNGSNVVLAASDAKGDTVSFKGTIDSFGTLVPNTKREEEI